MLSVYVVLTLLSTFASSFIWGINTLFLLDAGLSVTQAFAANAFFTAGPGDLRGADRRRGRHARAGGRRTCSARPRSSSRPFCTSDVEDPRSVLGLGDVLDAAGARLHLLLRRDRGLAGGRSERHRVPRHPRVGLRQGSDRQRASECSPARSPGGVIAQATNLGVPYVLRAVDPRAHLPRGLGLDAGRRLHAEAERLGGRGDAQRPRGPRSTMASATHRCAG